MLERRLRSGLDGRRDPLDDARAQPPLLPVQLDVNRSVGVELDHTVCVGHLQVGDHPPAQPEPHRRFTWLNPAVYLDTLVLLGTVASAHPASRWWFGAGAATASICWFVALGGAAAWMAPILRRPAAARLLEAFVAVVMTATALRTLPL